MVGRKLSSTGLLVVEFVVDAIDPGLADVGVALGIAPPAGVAFDDVPLFADTRFVDAEAATNADCSVLLRVGY